MISDYQAMPITQATYVGIPTAQDATPYDIIRVMNGDGSTTLTFTFIGASTKIIAPPVGVSDWVISGDCVSVTTLLNVIMS